MGQTITHWLIDLMVFHFQMFHESRLFNILFQITLSYSSKGNVRQTMEQDILALMEEI